MLPDAVSLFFFTARERYSILLRRRAGHAVWTEDPVFLHNRFCNVFREDDKTTAWFREHIREPLRDRPQEVLLATVAFRWFNRIETMQRIFANLSDKGDMGVAEVFSSWRELGIKDILRHVSPVVTGAYIIKTPDGMNKLDGVLWCIEQVADDIGRIRGELHHATLQHAVRTLCEYPYLGPFMAYQIVCDLKSTCVLEDARDRMSWAQVGPGSTRGLGRLRTRDPERFSRGSQADRLFMIEMMKELLALSQDATYWPSDWPRWEMSDVQHWLCELDKYCRVQEGGRMKQKYERKI